MIKTGVQTKGAVDDAAPKAGFDLLKKIGFSCADFSLNAYLTNISLYQNEKNNFFNQSEAELERYFQKHKDAAAEAGITINQMHMPYPMYVPRGKSDLNDYLWNTVAPKSMRICAF